MTILELLFGVPKMPPPLESRMLVGYLIGLTSKSKNLHLHNTIHMYTNSTTIHLLKLCYLNN